MILTAYNPSTDNIERSALSASYSAGVTTIVVRNSNNFNVNDRIMLGDMGNEKTEIVTVSAVNADGVTLTVGATKFPHAVDDAVYVLRYDQVKFYRSTTTIDGTYSPIATINLDVDNDTKTTRYDDLTGLMSYFYKISFYHSISTLESSLSDGIPGTNYTRSQVGYIVNDFLTEVGDLEQQYMNIPQILGVMNECNDDLLTQSKRPFRFLKVKQTLSIAAGNDRVALPTDLWKMHRVRYNYVFGVENRTDDIAMIDMEEMEYLKYDNTALTDDRTQRMAVDETTDELVIYPTPTTLQTNVITIYYWKKFTDFDSLGDTIELPTPRVYKLFLAARYYRMRALHDESFLPLSDRYANDYNSEVVKMQRANRIDIGTPMAMRPDVRVPWGVRKP